MSNSASDGGFLFSGARVTELAVAAGKFESGAALQDLLLSIRCSTNIFYLIGFHKGKLESEMRMFVQIIICNNNNNVIV